MRLVWDLDGVLRDLNEYLSFKFGVPYPQEWFWRYKGKDIFEWIEQDLYAPLVYSPATEYERIVKWNFEHPEIWTCQPDKWIPFTKLWLDNHFDEYTVHYLTNKEKRLWLDNNPEIWLVEDNPLFSSYERILLIDRPYNRHIKDVLRINSVHDLNKWMLDNLEVCQRA